LSGDKKRNVKKQGFINAHNEKPEQSKQQSTKRRRTQKASSERIKMEEQEEVTLSGKTNGRNRLKTGPNVKRV